MRRTLIVLLAGIVTAGCSNALSGVGDLSERVVHGDRSSTTTTTLAGPVIEIEPVTGVVWVNEGLDAGIGDGVEPDVLVARIWERGGGSSEFVQSSPDEIAAALSGLEFPRLVPTGVTHVSSQLVYDRSTLTLDPSQSAAFGLWSAEPYSIPRGEGQLAVLRVGRNQVPGTPENEYSVFRVSDGREVSWVDGAYVYSMFCRTGVSEEACLAVAGSTTTLAILTLAR